MGKFIIKADNDKYEIIKDRDGYYILTEFGEGEEGCCGGLGKDSEAVKSVFRDICCILETNSFTFTWKGGDEGDDTLEGE